MCAIIKKIYLSFLQRLTFSPVFLKMVHSGFYWTVIAFVALTAARTFSWFMGDIGLTCLAKLFNEILKTMKISEDWRSIYGAH